MEKGLHHLFTETAIKYPDCTAIITSKKKFTYQEIDTLSNQLAHQVKASGAQERDIVAILLEDKAWQIIAILALLKVNITYLPINEKTPKNRLEAMLKIANCNYLIGDPLNKINNIVNHIDYQKSVTYPKTNHEKPTKPLSSAYVIFTSGSTGAPKGVEMEHKGPLNTISDMDELFSLTRDDAIILNVNISFDPSVWLIFWPLTHGAHIVIPDCNKDADQLCKLILQHHVRLLHAGPALFSGMVHSTLFEQLHTLRLIVGGGQEWQLKQLKLLSQYLPNCGFCNLYGPTEASIHATVWKVPASDLRKIKNVSIGYPIKNMNAFILDEAMQPVPAKNIGELYLSGIGLAKGYINQPDATQTAFIKNSSGEVLYKTGDRAAFAPDGSITFHGRIDDQVQIRGYRVELSEVEKALSSAPLVKNSCIIVDDNDPENLKIRAIVELDDCSIDSKIINDNIKLHFKNCLPDYMHPASIEAITKIPLTENAKPDKKKLLDKYKNKYPKNNVIPNTTEEIISEVWQKVINNTATLQSNFFEAGGDSLDALKLVAHLNKKFDISLSVVEIFEHPSLLELTKHIKNLLKNNKTKPSITESLKTSNQSDFPLSDNQQWLLAMAKGSRTINNIVIPLELHGEVNLHTLQSAVHKLVASHEILRANILPQDMSRLFFRHERGNIFSQVEMKTSSLEEQNAYINSLYDQLNNQSIDLTTDPLFTVHAIHKDTKLCVLLIYMHHIISDPTSIKIIADELTLGNTVSPYQFKDYILQEQQQHSTPFYHHNVITFSKKLLSQNRWVNFGSADENNRKAGFYREKISTQLADTIVKFAKTQQQTLFVVFITSFAQAISRIYNQSDFFIGINISRRESDKYAHMIGPLSEQTVITFDQHVWNKDANLMEIIKHQLHNILSEAHVSLWQIFKHIKSDQDDFEPEQCFNTLFDYEPLLPDSTTNSLKVKPLAVKPSQEMRRHLTFRVAETKNGFEFQIRYRKTLFSSKQITELITQVLNFLEKSVQMTLIT